MRLYVANHSTEISSSSVAPPQGGESGGGRRKRRPGSRPFFALQFGRLLDGAVLVEQLQHFLLVVEHFHHGVSGLGHLVHHQLAALHVTLTTQTNTHTVSSPLESIIWQQHL